MPKKKFKFKGKTSWPSYVKPPYPPILALRMRLKDGTIHEVRATDQAKGFQPNDVVEVPDDPRAQRHMAVHPEWAETP